MDDAFLFTFLILIRRPNSGQCSHFILYENNRKPLVFWSFQGVWNRIPGICCFNNASVWVIEKTSDIFRELIPKSLYKSIIQRFWMMHSCSLSSFWLEGLILVNVPILYSVKTTESLWFSGVFRGYEMGINTRNMLL